MFASHAINHGCLVVLACFRTASSRASFLGVQPAECQKHTEKTRNRPLTCTHAWGILPSLPGIESIAPSSTPTTAPRMLQTAAKTPLGVCACDPHCLLFIGDSRCIRCKPPSFLGLFIELLLKLGANDEEQEPKEERSWPDHERIVLVTSIFAWSSLNQLVLLLHEYQSFFCPLLLQLLQLLVKFSLTVFRCCPLHVLLAHHQFVQDFLSFTLLFHIGPEGLTSPLQLYQALQLNLPSRLTGDEDLTFPLPEDLKLLFFLLVPGQPCDAHDIDPWFVWRQDSPFTCLCLAQIALRPLLLRDPLSLVLQPTVSACHKAVTFLFRNEDLENPAAPPPCMRQKVHQIDF